MAYRGLVFVLWFTLHSAGWAQAPKPFEPPRTPAGRPDFQGVWDRHSLTQLERPPGVDQLALNADEAAEVTKREFSRRFEQGGTSQQQPPHVVPARSLNRIGDDYRTSQITDPSDGKLPLTPEGIEFREAQRKRLDNPAEGPEQRTAQERCIAGAGRAPLVVVVENMMTQIVQTPDHLVIHSEHTNDLRIVRIGGTHWSSAITTWSGDSTADWDGDTLVIETINARDDDILRPQVAVRRQSRVVERLTLIAPGELLYQYTVEDPAIYARAWNAEFSLHRSGQRMFDGSCHEGNDGLASILLGAREFDRRAGATSGSRPQQ